MGEPLVVTASPPSAADAGDSTGRSRHFASTVGENILVFLLLTFYWTVVKPSRGLFNLVFYLLDQLLE